MLYTKEFRVSLEKFLEEKNIFYITESQLSKGIINYKLFVDVNNSRIPFYIRIKDLFIVFEFLNFRIIYKAIIETIDKIIFPEEIIDFFEGRIKFKVYQKNGKPIKIELYRLKRFWEIILKKRKITIKKPDLSYEFSIENFKKN